MRPPNGAPAVPNKISPPAITDLPPSALLKRPRKSALVLKLLNCAKGATLAEIAEPTGWLPHSTRAYREMSGVGSPKAAPLAQHITSQTEADNQHRPALRLRNGI